jgi:putative colanic acid biosynthesis UDP-glucose lipid carrier transferase
MAPKSATKLGQHANIEADEKPNVRPIGPRPDLKVHDDDSSADAKGPLEVNPTSGSRPWPIAYRDIAGFVAALDFVLIIAVGMFADALYHEVVFGDAGQTRRGAAVALFVAIIFVGFVRRQRLYEPSQLLLWNVQLNNVVWIWCATFFILSGWLFIWKSGDDVSRGAILSFWSIGLVFLLAHRSFWRFFIERALKRGSLRGRKIIVIARNAPMDSRFTGNLGRYGYEMLHQFVVRGSSPDEIENEIAQTIAFVRGSQIEEILLIVKSNDMAKLEPIIEQLRILPIPVTWVADGSTAEMVRQPWFELGTVVAVEMQRPPRSMLERMMKRAVDISGASCGLILLAPLLLIAAIAVKLDSHGPVFFFQTRRGFNGQTFKIVKFRSMYVLEDGDEVKQATKHDQRVTRVGAWIRKTSIDEIPQLLNVLRGDMSLVGPRPHAAAHDDQFIEAVEDYAYRNHVKPGITGWAQVHGYRGETPTIEAIKRRVDFDRWYINNWTVWLDITIMLRTLGAVVRGKNVY